MRTRVYLSKERDQWIVKFQSAHVRYEEDQVKDYNGRRNLTSPALINMVSGVDVVLFVVSFASL